MLIFFPFILFKYRLMKLSDLIRKLIFISVVSSLVFASSLLFSTLLLRHLNLTADIYKSILVVGISLIFSSIGCLAGSFLIRRMREENEEKFHHAQELLKRSGKGMIEIDKVERLAKIIPRYLTMFYLKNLGVSIQHADIFLLNEEKRHYALAGTAGPLKLDRKKTLSFDSAIYEWFTIKRKKILDSKIAQAQDIDILKIDDIDYWLRHPKFLSLESNMDTFLHNLRNEMENLQVMICIPGFFKDKLLGFLMFGHREGGTYGSNELDLFVSLSADAILALKNAELSELLIKFESKKAETEKLIVTNELMECVRNDMGNIFSNMAMVSVIAKKETDARRSKSIKKLSDKVDNAAVRVKTIWNHIDEYQRKSLSGEEQTYNLLDGIEANLVYVNEYIEKWNIKLFLNIDPRIIIKGKDVLPDAFKHLMINSCWSMEGIGGSISFYANMDSDGMVEITQTDAIEGHGALDEEEVVSRSKLFMEREKRGGIDLFLARKIVSDHNGTFHIESIDNSKIQYVIKLPSI